MSVAGAHGPVVYLDWSAVRLPGLPDRGGYVVLGATGAIGSRLTTALACLGAPVMALGRSQRALEALREEVHAARPEVTMGVSSMDITSRDSTATAFERAAALMGGIKGVVNCTGVSDGAMTAAEADPERVRRVLEINVTGTIIAASVAYPHLRAHGQGASLVNTASIAAYRAMPGGIAYGASKAAVIRATRQLAIEWGPDGIRVNCVSPAQTPTVIRSLDDAPGEPPRPEPPGGRGSKPSDVPLNRLGTLDDYVGPMLFLLSDLGRYMSGCDLMVDGGIAWRRFADPG